MANHEGNLLPEIRSISVAMMEGMSQGISGGWKEKKKEDPKQLLRLKGKLLLKMRGWTKHVLRVFFFVSPVKGSWSGILEIVNPMELESFWRIPEVLGGEKLVVYSIIFPGGGVKYVWCFFTPVSGKICDLTNIFGDALKPLTSTWKNKWLEDYIPFGKVAFRGLS